MKSKEEIISDAMKDFSGKIPSIENWLKSRITGIWENGYSHGREDGVEEGAALAAMHGSDATSQELEKSYLEGVECGWKKGLDDALRAAREVERMKKEEFIECFGESCWSSGKIGEMAAETIIKKLNKYKEKKKVGAKIDLGDEVLAENGVSKFYVTFKTDYEVAGVDSEGRTYSYIKEEVCGKTGKHVDVIGVLKSLENDSSKN